MTPLPFTLPPVLHLNWASTELRERWQAEFEDAPLVLARRWIELVRQGTIPASIIPARPFEVPRLMREAKEAGLKCKVLLDNSPFLARLDWVASRPFNLLGVGDEESLEALQNTLDGNNEAAFLRSAGWPDCCAASRAGLASTDPAWSFVLCRHDKQPDRLSNQSLDWHPLLRRLRLSALPHAACGPNCEASREMASQCRGDEPVDAILSWAISWSALHGLAEILLPVAKLVHTTDASAEKHVCGIHSENVPEGSPEGVVAPYRKPKRRALRDSVGFRAGITTPMETALPSIEAIARVQPCGSPPTSPAVLEGMADDWPALSRWTFDFLSKRFPDTQVRISKDDQSKEILLADYLAQVLNGQSDSWYLTDFGFEFLAPEMLGDFSLPPLLDSAHFKLDPEVRPGLRSLYIGGENSGTPLHVDILETCAYNTLIHGVKQWYFCPPTARSDLLASEPNLFDPQVRKRLRLSGVRILAHLQQAGETLFVPSGWWHQTRLIEPSISLTGNILNRWNMDKVAKAIQNSRDHPVLSEIGCQLLSAIESMADM